ERERLAFDGGERMARPRLEVVTLQVREDAVSASLELEQDLNGVVAGRNRAAENRDLFLLGEGTRVVGLVVLDGAVQNEERAYEAERRGHVVLKRDLGSGAGEPAR